MSTTKKILVTGAGGAAAISFISSLQKSYEIFMADMDKNSAGLYLVPKHRRLLLPAGQDKSYVPRLLELCQKYEIDVLVPTVDWELEPIAQSIDRFSAINVALMLSPYDAIATCLDKFTLMQVLSSHFDLTQFKKYDQQFTMHDLLYPVLAKPRCESGSRGIKVIKSDKDFMGIPKDGSYLIQQYLPGDEFSVDVYIDQKGHVLATVVRERIKIDSGIAVISQTLDEPFLKQQAAKMALYLGLRYAVNIQFKLNDVGYPCLLEINPRFPGTMPLTVAAGANMPQMAMDEILGETVSKVDEIKQVVMLRTWQQHFISPNDFVHADSETL